jgi:inosine/guanosine/xanthosine phosphorylase family protein
MTHNWNYKAKQAASFIRGELATNGLQPKILLVLGSGFRDVVDQFNIRSRLPFAKIPGYPVPTVQGHGSELLIAQVETSKGNIDLLIATGRRHLYEGASPFEVSLPIFVADEIGIRSVILTNAAGGISENMKLGTVVAISDHLNLTGQNVAATSVPPVFVAMDNAYSTSWRDAICKAVGITTGVYAGMLGPTFETSAEANMLKILGADLAGMSTVQEVIAARLNGQHVFACSFVTNKAGEPSAHGEVLGAVKASMQTIRETLLAAIELAP